MHPLEAEVNREVSPTLLAIEDLDISRFIVPDSILRYALRATIDATASNHRFNLSDLNDDLLSDGKRDANCEDVLTIERPELIVRA